MASRIASHQEKTKSLLFHYDPRVPSRVRRVIQVTSVGYSSAAMIFGHFHAAETGASRLEFAYHPVISGQLLPADTDR